MAGYSWEYGKSNNAVLAEQDSLMVATKAAKWVKRFIPGCLPSDIAAVIPSSEWHHTSKFFNKVDYYSPFDIYEYRVELRRYVKIRKLYSKYFKKYAVNGKFSVLTKSGLWHTIGPKDYEYISRMLCTVYDGYCLDFFPEREKREKELFDSLILCGMI